MQFTFENDVHALGVRGVYFNIRGMTNLPSDNSEVRAFVASRLADIPESLESSDAISGFQDLHRAVSAKPEKLVAASESLLKFYRAHGDIPRINGIVDVYNAISVSTGIAIGAHDLASVNGSIALRLTKGDEGFLPLGATKAVRVPPGEYAYVDDGNDILCRLEVRQVEKTKIVAASRDVFFIVQAHDRAGNVLIAQAASDLSGICTKLFGGSVELLYS